METGEISNLVISWSPDHEMHVTFRSQKGRPMVKLLARCPTGRLRTRETGENKEACAMKTWNGQHTSDGSLPYFSRLIGSVFLESRICAKSGFWIFSQIAPGVTGDT